jgi:hypothetical protein
MRKEDSLVEMTEIVVKQPTFDHEPFDVCRLSIVKRIVSMRPRNAPTESLLSLLMSRLHSSKRKEVSLSLVRAIGNPRGAR